MLVYTKAAWNYATRDLLAAYRCIAQEELTTQQTYLLCIHRTNATGLKQLLNECHWKKNIPFARPVVIKLKKITKLKITVKKISNFSQFILMLSVCIKKN